MISISNSDGKVDETSHNSLERPLWTTDHEEIGTKMFVWVKYIIDEHKLAIHRYVAWYRFSCGSMLSIQI